MDKIIKVTACDNELILIAYQWGSSYNLCRILSGNYNTVNVVMNLSAGAYLGAQVLDGINNPLNQNINLHLPAGDYQLLLVGIDWGGPAQFSVNVDNVDYNYPQTDDGDGLVWNPGPIKLIV